MFSQSCQEFCPRGVHLPPPWKDTPLGQTHPQGDTPSGQTPLSPGTATSADGTHPTGMHSCFEIDFIHICLKKYKMLNLIE